MFALLLWPKLGWFWFCFFFPQKPLYASNNSLLPVQTRGVRNKRLSSRHGNREVWAESSSSDGTAHDVHSDGNWGGSQVMPFPGCMNHSLNGNLSRKTEWLGNKGSCWNITGAAQHRRVFWDMPRKANTMNLEELSGLCDLGSSPNQQGCFSWSQTEGRTAEILSQCSN